MNKRLYVGNLPFDAEESALQTFFETDGRKVASVKIVTDQWSGKSRGFGFVELETEQDAESAVQTLNGKEWMGRALVINEAREKGAGFRSNKGGFGSGRRSFEGGGGGSGERNFRGGRQRQARW